MSLVSYIIALLSIAFALITLKYGLRLGKREDEKGHKKYIQTHHKKEES